MPNEIPDNNNYYCNGSIAGTPELDGIARSWGVEPNPHSFESLGPCLTSGVTERITGHVQRIYWVFSAGVVQGGPPNEIPTNSNISTATTTTSINQYYDD